ncbi:hypothetical protein [Leptospira stimsonii]|uniref:Lipoprotein n=1 Tax=Leptospira stimsonii TaxID=2202203 RepID=A0A8B3CQ00_9LEPT|nr:hypothetical protein [Leptospira stimsonii]RHX86092.1 hypothetical protein DLM78_09465 [Leptospira stimsonii]
MIKRTKLLFKGVLISIIPLLFIQNCNPGADNKDLTAPLVASQSFFATIPPTLNELKVNTVYQTGFPEDSQKVEISFSFQQTPTKPYSIKAYIGRPNFIELDADGTTVRNYIKAIDPSDFFPDRFIWTSPETSASYQIIVVTSNSFGKSTKKINSIAPTPPAGPCNGSIAAPTTIGNCAQHCIEVTMNGNSMEFVAKYTTTSVQDYLYLDFTTENSKGNTGPIPLTFVELGLEEPPVPISANTYSTIKKSFDTQAYTDACVNIASYTFLNSASGSSDSFVTKKITVP